MYKNRTKSCIETELTHVLRRMILTELVIEENHDI